MLVAPAPSRQAQAYQQCSEHRTNDAARDAGAAIHQPRSGDQPQAKRCVQKTKRSRDFRHRYHGDRDDKRPHQMIAVGERWFCAENEP